MKKFTVLLLMLAATFMHAQNTGSVKGLLTDKAYNNEPLAFANVLIKGTTTGTTSDFDGLYLFENLNPGEYILQFSFVGYETQEIITEIIADKTTEINISMDASTAALDEIIITTTTKRESEVALLLEQRKAVTIKESIGADRLSKIGVSNAANATTKISGVTKSEGSGDIYIRGLGDRYLSTTMNGLPIPSDDIENKNINLNLFSTNLIQNIGISKTYTTSGYADQTSGNVDLLSKSYSKKEFSLSLNAGTNSNVTSLDGDFKKSIISDNVSLGFHKKKYATVDLITNQGWDPVSLPKPMNYGISFSGGQSFTLLNKTFSVFAAGSHSKLFESQNGLFKSYRSNILDNSFTDTETFTSNTNTTGYLNAKLKLNSNHRISYNFLAVNKGIDNVYEQGRNGLGYVFDQDPQEDGAFVRDQNFKQTTVFINQILGNHKLSENHRLKWASGYNFVLAEEPNRIRNEANILDENTVQYAHVGDFQQRKSSQKIEDIEYNAYVLDAIAFGKLDAEEVMPFKLNIGANIRQKERNFISLFIGVRARDFQVETIDQFSDTFTTSNFNNGIVLRVRDADRYNANLNIYAGFANLDFGINKSFSGTVGLRYEKDDITILWDVANYVGRVGSITKKYAEVFPSTNLKYQLSEKHFLRFAASLTQTLPEFKELAPFEYVSPTGRVTRGVPDLEKSEVTNIDLKWEFFPKHGELISATTFYKQIKNPINLAQTRGSSGIFEYANTGKAANVFGIELETRLNLIENEDDKSILNFNANLSKMWFNQDLGGAFQYNNYKKTDLQGASNLILNASLGYNSQSENAFIATLTGNYSSDKIFALGSPEDFANSDVLFNNEIIEKGFFTMDLVISKKLSEKIDLKLIASNLLNPSIEQTQKIRSINNGVTTNELVNSYKNGSQFNLSLKYSF